MLHLSLDLGFAIYVRIAFFINLKILGKWVTLLIDFVILCLVIAVCVLLRLTQIDAIFFLIAAKVATVGIVG
mgnify:CR=1 FL=1